MFFLLSRLQDCFLQFKLPHCCGYRSQPQCFSAFDGHRRHLLLLSLTPVPRTPCSAHLGSPLCSLLGPRSSYPGPILFTPELTGSAESISCFQQSGRGACSVVYKACIQFSQALSLVSQTQSTTTNSQSSKSKVPQVNLTMRPPCDSEKQGTHAKPSGDLVSYDQTRNKSPDTLHVMTCDKS